MGHFLAVQNMTVQQLSSKWSNVTFVSRPRLMRAVARSIPSCIAED